MMMTFFHPEQCFGGFIFGEFNGTQRDRAHEKRPSSSAKNGSAKISNRSSRQKSASEEDFSRNYLTGTVPSDKRVFSPLRVCFSEAHIKKPVSGIFVILSFYPATKKLKSIGRFAPADAMGD
jgi:hypothetical protein